MANEAYIPDAEAGAEEAVRAALEAMSTEEDEAYYEDLFGISAESSLTAESSDSTEGEDFSVYTNGVARALDNIQRVFPSPLCDLLQNLANLVEDRFGAAPMQIIDSNDLAQDLAAQPVEELEQAAEPDGSAVDSSEESFSASIPDETLRQTVETAAVVSPSAFVSGLNDAADALRSNDASVSFLSDMQGAVARSAWDDPVETGGALQLFNDTAKEQIEAACEAGTPEYETAMDSLSTVMQTMTGTYYAVVLESEASAPLSFADKRQLDRLSLTGVNIAYGEYLPGDDVSVAKDPQQSEQDSQMHFDIVAFGSSVMRDKDVPDRLKESDGSLYRDADDAHRAAYESAATSSREAVSSGAMLDAVSPDSSSFDAMRAGLSETVYKIRQEIAEGRLHSEDDASVMAQASDSYMTMMRGLQAYNDASVQAIRETYQDDPQQMHTAANGLANLMRSAVGSAFDLLKDDDSALGFLSEQDKLELDRMQFTGVNVPYSSYWKGMDLKTGELPSAYEDIPVAELEDMDPIYSGDDFTDFTLYGGNPETETRTSASQPKEPFAASRTAEPAAAKRSYQPLSQTAWDSGLFQEEPSEDDDYSLL